MGRRGVEEEGEERGGRGVGGLCVIVGVVVDKLGSF